jgi:signal transduction histidine kinase
MKSEFISVASHQLRTPLSAIRWETELLLSKHAEGLDARQLKTIENISSLSHKMTRLVNDLLDVAQIDQRRLILKRKPFDLAKNVETSLEELKPIFSERHIEYAFKAEKNLPMAVADQEKMKLVVDNLIRNAVKYTTSGGKVEVGLFQRKENLVFEVKDNGVGIPEEQQDRVFQKFFRSDNAAKYQTEGTGLGLYIAKNVIEQLGGKIWFQSIENVGSIFSFSLPISACPGK